MRPSTHARREQALRSLWAAAPHLRGARIDRVAPADLEDAVAAVGRRAPRQAQIALATVKLALRNARDRRQPVPEALLAVQSPRAAERDPVLLTWPQAELLASWMPEQSKRLVLITVLTGARQGELLALRESDIDLEKATITITGSLSGPANAGGPRRARRGVASTSRRSR
ncbi:MAG: hypothetical protein ABR583_08315 [Gaiellaceae bacterium]